MSQMISFNFPEVDRKCGGIEGQKIDNPCKGSGTDIASSQQ